jgi:hypothetical protein
MKVISAKIKYTTLIEEEGVCIGGGNYILELKTQDGVFSCEVEKMGEFND